jgi:hypothetical protein
MGGKLGVMAVLAKYAPAGFISVFELSKTTHLLFRCLRNFTLIRVSPPFNRNPQAALQRRPKRTVVIESNIICRARKGAPQSWQAVTKDGWPTGED